MEKCSGSSLMRKEKRRCLATGTRCEDVKVGEEGACKQYTAPRTYHTRKLFSRVAQVAAFCLLSEEHSSSRVHVIFSHLAWSCTFLVHSQHSDLFFPALSLQQDRSVCTAILFGRSAEQSPLTEQGWEKVSNLPGWSS